MIAKLLRFALHQRFLAVLTGLVLVGVGVWDFNRLNPRGVHRDEIRTRRRRRPLLPRLVPPAPMTDIIAVLVTAPGLEKAAGVIRDFIEGYHEKLEEEFLFPEEANDCDLHP